jgi:hypothetical protein
MSSGGTRINQFKTGQDRPNCFPCPSVLGLKLQQLCDNIANISLVLAAPQLLSQLSCTQLLRTPVLHINKQAPIRSDPARTAHL